MPGRNTVPPTHARTHITPRNAVWLLSLAAASMALLTLTHPAFTVAFCAVVLAPIVSDLGAARLSPWVVYVLRDRDGHAIYVGQTDDPMRRMYQHTDGVEHSWWRDIEGFTIWQHCWTLRQSERVEQRLVGVINRCSDKDWCDKLRNEQFGEDHRKTSRALPIMVWRPVYMLSSWMVDSRSFTRPAAYFRSIPQRPNRQHDDDYADHFDGFDNAAGPSEEHRTEATYERPSNGRQRMGLEPLALPPASCHTDDPVTACHSRNKGRSPLAGDTPSQDPGRDTQQTPGATGATIRDAHRRQQAATVGALPDDLAAHLTREEADALADLSPDELKVLRDRLRQRKSRANRAAAADRSPTYTARTRQASGGGAGEG